MKTALISIAVVAALWGLHRLFWWMEDCGWINYWGAAQILKSKVSGVQNRVQGAPG
jgi:hypothetical protein